MMSEKHLKSQLAVCAELLVECLSVLYTLDPESTSEQVHLYDLEAKVERAITAIKTGQDHDQNQAIA